MNPEETSWTVAKVNQGLSEPVTINLSDCKWRYIINCK